VYKGNRFSDKSITESVKLVALNSQGLLRHFVPRND